MTYSKFGLKQCSSRSIVEATLEKSVVYSLRDIAKTVLSDGFCEQFNDIVVVNDTSEKERITRRLSEIKNTIKALYVDKVKGIIDEELFIEMSGQFSDEKSRLAKRIIELESEVIIPTNHDYKAIIKQLSDFEIVDRAVLVKLINRVEISKDREIFIFYNFPNPAKTA